MAFNWEENAFLGYMVEQYEKSHNQTNSWDDEDYDEEESQEEENLNWWER